MGFLMKLKLGLQNYLVMNFDENNAAESLKGLVLKERWKVIDKTTKVPGGTGGHFSIGYKVEDINNGTEGFLKALNFKAFFSQSKTKDILTVITEENSAFQYERDVLLRCQNFKLSKVVTLLDEGLANVEGFAIPQVPFLIFELADGDLYSKIEFSNKLDLLWKLKSLHDVAVGLKQLHWANISHQDLKPSNVLLQQNGLVSKIADLGRSVCLEIQAPHEVKNGKFNGDSDYMPIEYYYKYEEPDWTKRTRSTDMYLFGNLVCFYFTGLNMTTLIIRNTDKQFRWNNWNGSYTSVKDYLMVGFNKALNEFKSSILDERIKQELAKILQYCCFPYPEKRGHPRSIDLAGNQYEFHRTISRLDVILKETELNLIRHGGKLQNK